MTNIIGISALQELRKVKGFENAIIAGGFCRDSILGGEFKDIDIFIPCQSSDEFENLIYSTLGETVKTEVEVISKVDYDYLLRQNQAYGVVGRKYKISYNPEFDRYEWIHEKRTLGSSIGNFKDVIITDTARPEYMKTSSSFIGKADCKYMGTVDCDIIGMTFKEYKDFEGRVVNSFGDHVVQSFDYDICKVWTDSSEIIESEEFIRDKKNRTATLSKLPDMKYLPNALERFMKLKQKYPDLKFNTTCLELKKEEQNQTKQYKSIYTGSSTATNKYFGNFIGNF